VTTQRHTDPGFLRRLIGLLSRREAETDEAGGEDTGTAVAAAPTSTDVDELARQRRALVDVCMVIVDQADSEMLREQVAEALAQAGVRPVRAEGEQFDQNRHRAAGRVPTEDASRHGIIAVTQREGYMDGDTLIRKPEVLVYRRQAT
jgi:molecular chaperone GrpE